MALMTDEQRDLLLMTRRIIHEQISKAEGLRLFAEWIRAHPEDEHRHVSDIRYHECVEAGLLTPVPRYHKWRALMAQSNRDFLLYGRCTFTAVKPMSAHEEGQNEDLSRGLEPLLPRSKLKKPVAERNGPVTHKPMPSGIYDNLKRPERGP